MWAKVPSQPSTLDSELQDPDRVSRETLHIVDFAASVETHSNWWSGGKPTAAGLANLAQTLTGYLGGSTPGSSPSAPASANITVASTTNFADSFDLDGERLTHARTIVSVGDGMSAPTAPRSSRWPPRSRKAGSDQHQGAPVRVRDLPTDPSRVGHRRPCRGRAHAATSFYTRLLKVPVSVLRLAERAVLPAQQVAVRAATTASYGPPNSPTRTSSSLPV